MWEHCSDLEFVLVNYLKLIRDDYKSAFQDGVVDAKARPRKAAVYGTSE